MNQTKTVRFVTLATLVLIAFLILTRTTFLTIEPGHAGVKFKRFGGGLQKEKIYEQGFHVVAPWDKMFIYDIRIDENFEEMEVLSKNGLTIVIDLSLRYRPTPEELGFLHDRIGTGYLESIIMPEIRSATREVIGKYNEEELYSSKREAIQIEIFERTAEELKKSIN